MDWFLYGNGPVMNELMENSGVYLGSCQISMMELFVKVVNGIYGRQLFLQKVPSLLIDNCNSSFVST